MEGEFATPQDKGKAKKELKKLRSGTLAAIASSYGHILRHYPADAYCDVTPTTHRPFLEHWRPDHLQAAVLWMLSLVPAPNFLHVRNKGLVANIVFVVVRGATHQNWEDVRASAPDAVPLLSAWPCVKTKQPRGVWSPRLKQVLPIDTEVFFKKRSEAPAAYPAPACSSEGLRLAALSTQHALAAAFDLCLNLDELRSHGFAVPCVQKCGAGGGRGTAEVRPSDASFVLTRTAQQDALAASGAATVCGSGTGGGGVQQLARVTVVDECGAVVLDEIVRPELPILDYLTQYSGMTPALIATARLSFSEVQRRVIDIIDGVAGEAAEVDAGAAAGSLIAGTKRHREDGGVEADRTSAAECLRPAILVGHSLEADLSALRIVHTRVIDTTVLYPHPSSLPYRHSLRNLTRMHLGRSIQGGHGSTGHDSTEDAVAALHLVLLHLHKNVPAAAAAAAAGDTGPPSESERAVPEFGRLLSARGREGMLMPLAVSSGASGKGGQDDQRRRSSESGSARVGGNAGNTAAEGVAATLSALGGGGGSGTGSAAPSDAGPDASTAAANHPPLSAVVTLDLREPPRRRSAHVSVLAEPELADRSLCSGTTVIGSVAFTSAHLVAGSSASAVVMPCSGGQGDTKRALSRAADVARRLHRGRMEGRWTGVGLTLVEVGMPSSAASAGSGTGDPTAPAACQWRTLDGLLREWCSELPPGTAVFVSTTQGTAAGRGVRATATVAAAAAEAASEAGVDDVSDPRLWGSTFLHCVNTAEAIRPPAQSLSPETPPSSTHD